MSSQNGRGRSRADWAFETCLDRLCFAQFGRDAENFFGFEKLPNRNRNRSSRNLAQTAEPAFADLLAAAGLVEIDDEIRRLCLKISGRIVESQMPIFADADKRNLNRAGV